MVADIAGVVAQVRLRHPGDRVASPDLPPEVQSRVLVWLLLGRGLELETAGPVVPVCAIWVLHGPGHVGLGPLFDIHWGVVLLAACVPESLRSKLHFGFQLSLLFFDLVFLKLFCQPFDLGLRYLTFALNLSNLDSIVTVFAFQLGELQLQV